MQKSKTRRNVDSFRNSLGYDGQRCSDSTVVCKGDAEDSQGRWAALIETWSNKGRGESLCGIGGETVTDRTNANEFKITSANQIGNQV